MATLSDTVIRGRILSADGQVLARTDVAEDGTETRVYPYGPMFAHAVGYNVNGMAGVELDGNFNLLRSNAFVLERLVNEITGQKNQGDDLVTTLNYNLQETAYDGMGNYDGAVVALEPSTGKILAMVSKPDFNPNSIAKRLGQPDFRGLQRTGQPGHPGTVSAGIHLQDCHGAGLYAGASRLCELYI